MIKTTKWELKNFVHTKSDFIRMVWAGLDENNKEHLFKLCKELIEIAQKKKWMAEQ